MSEAINDLLQRDAAVLRESLASSLIGLGWHQMLGKQREGEQTLLEHSLAVVDVLFACAPFFAAEASPKIQPSEFLGMALAAVAHDAGKASHDFQAYLRGQATAFANHVDPEEIRRVVAQVGQALHVELPNLEDIVSEAILHDRHMRRDRGELVEWSRAHESSRWRKLADFVNHADSVASAPDVVGAWSFLLTNPLLLGGARAACYQLNLRGVSTTLLHEAALESFGSAGYVPILHFAGGTVYGGFGPLPTREEIAAALKLHIEALFEQRSELLPELTVGQPLSDFLPRPEYVRRGSIDALLGAASRRVHRKTGTSNGKDEQKWRRQWAEHSELKGSPPSAADLQALLDIGPEACAFRLAKELFSKVLDSHPDHETARRLYDAQARFGDGAFDRLMGQSTYMPVQDYARCVRPWHQRRRGKAQIGSMEPGLRTKLLLRKLGCVIRGVLRHRAEPLPSDRLADEWVGRLMGDISIEAAAPSREQVARQLGGYVALKARQRGKARPPQQCVQCAGLIEPGEAHTASDALGNVGSYSNRRLAFDSPGSPPVCPACVADIELGQLSLGRPVRTVIALVPRRSLGPQAAAELVRRVRQARSVVDRQLSPETADPSSYVALTFPQDALRASSLAEAAVRPLGEKTRKGRAKELAEALLERLGDEGLKDLNDEHATSFEDVDDLARSLIGGSAPPAVRDDTDVCAAVAGVLGGGRADFAAVTPNLVVVSLDRELGDRKTSDADRALYSFGLAALFALELGSACLVAPVAELRTALATRTGRTVYVPANGPARRIMGADWLGIESAARWLRAVQAAVALEKRAGAGSILEVLRYPSAGYAIRRIEQQPDGGSIGPSLWPFVEALKEVLG